MDQLLFHRKGAVRVSLATTLSAISMLVVLIVVTALYASKEPSKARLPKNEQASLVLAKPSLSNSPSVSNSAPRKHIRLSSVPNAEPRQMLDTSGFALTIPSGGWDSNATLQQIKQLWLENADTFLKECDDALARRGVSISDQAGAKGSKAAFLMSQGHADQAYELIDDLRTTVEKLGPQGMRHILGTTVFFQGMAALRLGENENCVMCIGDSACIFPIKETAIHKNVRGSTKAVEHFTEYLEAFPNDLEAKWLLNVAHMTLGEYPDKVNPKYLLQMDKFNNPSETLGPYKDVGMAAGINRLNQAGGSIVEDLDGDGWLDLAHTTWDIKTPMCVYQNMRDGTFKDRSANANIEEQTGALNCVQTDYNNDGKMDLYLIRGAWLPYPVRHTLLRNDGDFKFTDVTKEAGLLDAVNSNASQWADYNNDGLLDLFVCCEKQAHHLYKNMGNGKFAEVTKAAGISADDKIFGKGCFWIDYDNDRLPDLFINYYDGTPQLFHNNGDETFSDVTKEMGIDGPFCGFSCWCWDVNNDGWLDIFATCYERTVKDIVKGIVGEPHGLNSNRLFINQGGKGFKDVAKEAGLDMVFAAMGTNFGDLDNDGYLDFYLGTGDPDFTTLVPNRMFKNIKGTHFVEVTKTSRTGHLQKGHGVSFADYDRDNDLDLFIQMGGAVDGDRFRNILFQNPGTENSSITLKLVGDKSNRAAIGARIKVVTEAAEPLTVHRLVCSGSSFGANPLEQTIGIADATKVAKIEVYWPTSDKTQVFENLDINQAYTINESSDTIAVTERAARHVSKEVK